MCAPTTWRQNPSKREENMQTPLQKNQLKRRDMLLKHSKEIKTTRHPRWKLLFHLVNSTLTHCYLVTGCDTVTQFCQRCWTHPVSATRQSNSAATRPLQSARQGYRSKLTRCDWQWETLKKKKTRQRLKMFTWRMWQRELMWTESFKWFSSREHWRG